MKKTICLTLATVFLGFNATAFSATGIVNPTSCMEKSKFAAAKRSELDSFGKELQSKLETLHKEYKEIEFLPYKRPTV